MIDILRSDEFEAWLLDLRDDRARARIQARILRLSLGSPGDVKPVGEGISELRIDYGPGYRVYFWQRGRILIGCFAAAISQHRTKTLKLPRPSL